MNKIDFQTLQNINETFGSFDIGQTFGGDNSVYLRFGYWKQVDIEKLQEIIGNRNVVTEDTDYEEDTGWVYKYEIKSNI